MVPKDSTCVGSEYKDTQLKQFILLLFNLTFTLKKVRIGYEAKSNVPATITLDDPEKTIPLYFRRIFGLLPYVRRLIGDSTRTLMPLYNQSQNNHDLATFLIVNELFNNLNSSCIIFK